MEEDHWENVWSQRLWNTGVKIFANCRRKENPKQVTFRLEPALPNGLSNSAVIPPKQEDVSWRDDESSEQQRSWETDLSWFLKDNFRLPVARAWKVLI